MHVRYHLPKQFYQLVKHNPKELSSQAKIRLQTLRAWEALREAGYSADQASRKIGAARATVYRWQKRLRERNIRGLEEDSRRPRRLRTVSWEPALIEAVLEPARAVSALGKREAVCAVGQRRLAHLDFHCGTHLELPETARLSA